MFTEIDDPDDSRLNRVFEEFTSCAWRLATLREYQVRTETEPYYRFLAGEASAARDATADWIAKIVAPAVAEGSDIGRVHVIERTVGGDGKLNLGQYLKFKFECYKHTREAGEAVRIAVVEPGKWPPGVWLRGHDFWLFDEDTNKPLLVELHHHLDGTFRKAVITTNDHPEHIERAVKCKQAALRHSKPFYP